MNEAESVLAWLNELEVSQWRSPQALWRRQQRALQSLVGHARQTVPFYRDRLAPVLGRGRFDPARWSDLPVLERHEVLDNFESLRSTAVPADHGRIIRDSTSGSSGSPVRLLRTRRSTLRSVTLIHRGFAWHGIDPTAKMAHIISRAAPYPDGQRYETWSALTELLGIRGELVRLDINTPVERQVDWLRREQPRYLQTYPSNARALARLLADDPVGSLEKLCLIGETVSAETREELERLLRIDVVDRYGTIDAGQVAWQCPTGTHYHVHNENLLVEVLDPAGRQVAPGACGRIVVTPLSNYAFPLVRYSLGDVVEVGPPCSCGRGLPVLSRILGRERHMFRFPDGSTIWPAAGRLVAEFLRPRRWQVAQVGPLEIEVRYVPLDPDFQPDFQNLADRIRSAFSQKLDVRYRCCNELPMPAGGKFHDFVCEL